jgi:two-component system, NtrC family, sensor histidine kinase PilS
MNEKSNYHYQLSITYFIFRIILAVALAGISLADTQYQIAGDYQTINFILTVAAYFLLALIVFFFTALTHKAPKDKTLFFAIITDILFCVALMHLGGGFSTGLGILLLSPVAIAGIFFYGAIAFSIAAAGSILILLDVLYISSIENEHIKYLVPAGLLGSLFFITSMLTQLIAKYIRRTEQKVYESIDEVTDLNKLNEFIVQRMLTGIIVIDPTQKVKIINTIANQFLHQKLQAEDYITGNIKRLFEEWLKTQQNSNVSFQDSPGLPSIKVSFSMVETKNNLAIAFIEDQSSLTQQAQHLKLASLGRLSASIAHEIRNPLSSINQSTQLLLESKDLIPDDMRLLAIIENNAVRLNNIVSNVLDISRKSPSQPHNVEINKLVERIKNQLAQTRGISITLVNEIDDGFIVLFDESQLYQVLLNLLDNAITYSFMHSQEYWVKLKSWQTDDIPHLAIFDHGIGIPPENADKIFEPFFTTNPQGTGLGLYISKDLCEMNQALLDYIYGDDGVNFFQIRFVHRGKRIFLN